MHFRVQEGAERNSGHPPPPPQQTNSLARAERPKIYSFEEQRRPAASPAASLATGGLRRAPKLLTKMWRRFWDRVTACQPKDENAWGTITDAASIGEISEYNLFCAAWTAWYGTRAKDREIEKLFGACLNGAELPCYVRHFARQLRSAGNDPALAFDRTRFGLDRYPRKEALILP